MCPTTTKPLIGISSCLLGNPVRYDGKNKRNEFLISYLGKDVELIIICPEVGIGLGVPRAPIQLIKKQNITASVFTHDQNIDVTLALKTYAKSILQEHEKLSGFIFKSKSPSCGLHDVPVFVKKVEQSAEISSGIFAEEIMRLRPQLPVENEENLQHQASLDKFIRDVNNYRP